MGNLINYRDLLYKNKIDIYANCDGLGNSSFWYYTSLSTANLILLNNCFHVRNISVMNDLNEAELHKEDCQFIHALCFCNSDTEKIPMWYLYSGIDGKGTSIGLTKSLIRQLILSIKTVKTPDDKILHIGHDFDIDYGWIFYQKRERKNEINYRRKWYEINDSEEFLKNNYFVKNYPWEYEKEFRILIKNKTKKPYEKLILDIPPSICEKIKLKFAPEFDFNSFEKEIALCDGIKKYFVSKALFSNLSVKMNILNRNQEKVLEFISSTISIPESKIKPEDLCKLVACTHKCKSSS